MGRVEGRGAGVRGEPAGRGEQFAAGFGIGMGVFLGQHLEQREFDRIEERVDKADARMAAAHDRLEDTAVVTDPAALTEALAEMEAAQAEHDAVYQRWAELTEKAG